MTANLFPPIDFVSEIQMIRKSENDLVAFYKLLMSEANYWNIYLLLLCLNTDIKGTSQIQCFNFT